MTAVRRTVGQGTLAEQRHGAPCDYRGTLTVEGREHAVEAWWRRDDDGRRCLAFDRSSTLRGVLWPAESRPYETNPDLIGVIVLDRREWRLRAWRQTGSRDLTVTVKE